VFFLLTRPLMGDPNVFFCTGGPAHKFVKNEDASPMFSAFYTFGLISVAEYPIL